jgi:hypothetical protein
MSAPHLIEALGCEFVGEFGGGPDRVAFLWANYTRRLLIAQKSGAPDDCAAAKTAWSAFLSAYIPDRSLHVVIPSPNIGRAN